MYAFSDALKKVDKLEKAENSEMVEKEIDSGENKEEIENKNKLAQINDVRTKRDFRGIVFSNFKKNDVKKELIDALVNSKYESSCYWSAEFICAGHYDELWGIIFVFFYKYIHVSNPKLCIYLKTRWGNFKHIMDNGYNELELSARNNVKIRQIFCEVVCVLCCSNKNNSLINQTTIKLGAEDYQMDAMQEKLCSADVIYINELFQSGDPRELFVVYNEFVFHLSNNSTRNACYWMEWIVKFEQNVVSGECCRCEQRPFTNNVDAKFKKDVVWMIWDAFFVEARMKKNSKIIKVILDTYLDIFTSKYTPAYYNKYKSMMYFIVQLLSDSTMRTMSIEMIPNKECLEHFIFNINQIYAQIKCNEHSPNTDYLFDDNNNANNNINQTIAKLDAMYNTV